MNNMKILWAVIVIVAIISVIGFFNGRTVTQVIENPLGAVSTPYFPGPEFSINELNTYVARTDFKDATTTFVMFANPMIGTSTIDFVELVNTGVSTSSYNFSCGKSTDVYVPQADILKAGIIATSSYFGTVFNNVATSSGSNTYSGGDKTRIAITAGDYFVCKAYINNTDVTVSLPKDYDANGISGVGNTFNGYIKVRFVR